MSLSAAASPQCHRVDLSRAFHPSLLSLFLFFCPDTSTPSADSHASAFSSNILHLHASLYPICKLLPPLPGPRLWPSTTASRACLPSNHFPHIDQRDSCTHLWPLLAPPIHPLASLVLGGKPASLPTWVPHLRCLLAAIPTSCPASRSQGSWVASPLLTVPLVPGVAASGPRSSSSPFLKEASPSHPGALTPSRHRTLGRKIAALTLSLPELPVGDVVPLFPLSTTSTQPRQY